MRSTPGDEQVGTCLWVNTAGSTVEFAARISLIGIGVPLVPAVVLLKFVDSRLRIADLPHRRRYLRCSGRL